MVKPRKPLPKISAKRLAADPSLGRRSSTIAPSRKPVKPRNAKRRESEFARCYFSKERVAFVKSLPCVVCTGITGGLSVGHGASDNAHTGERSGMGRKAGYETIVPMCRPHHERFDRYGEPFNIEECREAIQALAPKIESLWRSHLTETERGK